MYGCNWVKKGVDSYGVAVQIERGYIRKTNLIAVDIESGLVVSE